MATLSTASLRGSSDPQTSTHEDTVDSEQDLKLSSEDLKKASKELSDLLCIDESTDVSFLTDTRTDMHCLP